MIKQPPISVLVPTYGRTNVLGEAIESFLRQAYGGHREMIVLNDHPEQVLSLDPSAFSPDYPVTIINVGERFPDLGTKRNTLVDMATHDLVTFWDDDDVYLPHALSVVARLYVRRLERGRRAGRASHCWQLQANTGTNRAPGLGGLYPTPGLAPDSELAVRDSGCMWHMAVERDAIREVGGFPAQDRKQDVALMMALIRARVVGSEGNTPGIPACIHRLVGTGRPHASESAWQSAADNSTSASAYAAGVAALMDDGQEARGDVCINPSWRHDYQAIAERAWVSSIPDRTLPRHGEPASS